MSTTQQKRNLSHAIRDAELFRGMFDGCYESWTIAGSARRMQPYVGDIEHVVIPRFKDVATASDLFATPIRTNLLWHRIDRLVLDRTLNKHMYGTAGYRWGEKYRGVDFNGFNNEIFCADRDNLGSVLGIRTGPPEFSKSLVVALIGEGRRNKDGYVWRCNPCVEDAPDKHRNCRNCQGTFLVPVERLSVPTEEMFFQLAGISWVVPELRGVR
jgi:DNA polymerase/3'-5' exonuclease PolX